MEWYCYVIIGLVILNLINSISASCRRDEIKWLMQNTINCLENSLDKYENFLMKYEGENNE